MIDRPSLMKRKKELEARFNEIQQQVNDAQQELLRLQGEYRAIDGLLAESKKAKKTKANEANTVIVEEAPDHAADPA